MNRRITALLLIAILAGCSDAAREEQRPSDPPHPDRSEQNETLDGRWVIVKTLRNGEPYPQENGGTCDFDLPAAIVTTTDGVETEYEIRVDPEQNPKHIDWISKEQGTLRGLYEIHQGTLKTCSPPLYDADRPDSLETKPGDGRWVFHMRRPSEDDRLREQQSKRHQ